MAHDVQVQRIVLLPRFTSFAGARTFRTAPLNVRLFASAVVSLWIGNGIGSSPSYQMQLQESPDLKIWTTISTFNPSPETELAQDVTFSREWARLVVTLAGVDPAFTCWSVGDFVTRVTRA